MSDQATGAAADSTVSYELTLYVNGASDSSRHAIAGARAICDAELTAVCELFVVDLQSHAAEAHAAGVVATPTLIRMRPLPRRQFVGDLSKAAVVARALGLPSATPQR